MAHAKSLCTASELALVKSSSRSEIGKLSAAQLRMKVSRARKLRDKWRDQAMAQRRTTQKSQRARQTEANARSTEKAELFGEVLGRYEVRLAKLETKGQSGDPAKKPMAKRARSATHRAARAVARDSLKDARLELGGRKKAKPPAPAKTKSPVAMEPKALDVATEAAESTTAPSRSTKRKTGQGKLAASGIGMTALESARAVQGLRVTKGKQLRATTAAKGDRLKAAGKRRIQMHASARGRRRQGKRDAR
jgi:hypothetical protein